MVNRRQEGVLRKSREGITDEFPGAGGRIALLLRQLPKRDGKRVDQKELARLAGVSRATLSVAINADRLTGRTARKLAAVLNTTEEALLYEDAAWDPAQQSAARVSEAGPNVQTYSGSGARLNDLMFGSELSRSELAARAGVSRDTLHTALNDQMTLKTARKLAAALGTTADALLYGEPAPEQWEPSPDAELAPSLQGVELEEFVSNMDQIILTLRNFPSGPLGVRIKIGFLNLVEDVARDTGNTLPIEYYKIRKEVQDGAR